MRDGHPLLSDPTADESYVGTFSEIDGIEVRPWARYKEPKPQCQVCSVRTICEGCRHDEGCNWCYCDGLGCSTCGTKCRSHASRELWQEDVGTFDIWLELDGQGDLSLPAYIPAVKAREKLKDHLPKWTYTISVSDLIRTDGSPREVAYRVRRFFPEGSQLILNFFAPDKYLEPIWRRGEGFWDDEWLQNFDAVIAVNYSLYDDDASFEVMHSLKRTFVSAQEISDAGLTPIPLLHYVTEKQLYEQVEALGPQRGLHTVAVNFQTVDVEGEEKLDFQRRNLELLSYVAYRTDWRVIVYGISRPDIVGELSGVLGRRLVLSSSDPYFRALRRHTGRRRKAFNEGIERNMELVSQTR